MTRALPLVTRLLEGIPPTNSQLINGAVRDPATPADRVGRMIWPASGENPGDGLATFIEIFVPKSLSDLGALARDDGGAPVPFMGPLRVDRDTCLKYHFGHVRGPVRSLPPPRRSADGHGHRTPHPLTDRPFFGPATSPSAGTPTASANVRSVPRRGSPVSFGSRHAPLRATPPS